MALTFPLAMPAAALRVRDRRFDLEPANVEAPTWGGLVQSVNIGRILWGMQYDLVTLRESEAFAVLSFLRVLRSGARAFKATDPLRRFAIEYPSGYEGMTKAGGGSFTGTAVLDDVGEQLDTVELSGLPAGFQFKPGDLLSFGYASTRQALHTVVEAANASGAGVATLTVEPPVVPGWAESAEVQLEAPWCKARIVRGSIREQWLPNRRCVISFAARQDIRP